LIEALAFLFIFSIITVTFYSAWSLGTRYILLSKNRVIAIAVANEKMEVVRNLAFEDIAHTTGFPAGNLLQDEDVVRSGGTYHVNTQIINRDDPFDGTLVAGTDVNFVDYKDVKISVSWGNAGQSVSLSSRFVPAGIEQPTPGTGVLVVNVTSEKDGGAFVSNATVQIQNSSIGYNETHTTDSTGSLMIVGIPAAIKQYVISVSKAGYESVSTLPPYPTSPYNPTHEYASVVALAINTADIYLNKLAHFTVETKDSLGADVPNMNFHLTGGRTLGTSKTDPTLKYYNTDADAKTDGSGKKDYGNVSPGPYTFSLKEAGYNIIGMNRAPSFTLAPDETATLTVKVSPTTATAALFKVQKDIDDTPLSGANVHVTNVSLTYDVTVTTDTGGYAFFPTDATPFVAGTYNYTVSVSGYADATGSVSVSAGALKIETVPMATP